MENYTTGFVSTAENSNRRHHQDKLSEDQLYLTSCQKTYHNCRSGISPLGVNLTGQLEIRQLLNSFNKLPGNHPSRCGHVVVYTTRPRQAIATGTGIVKVTYSLCLLIVIMTHRYSNSKIVACFIIANWTNKT